MTINETNCMYLKRCNTIELCQYTHKTASICRTLYIYTLYYWYRYTQCLHFTQVHVLTNWCLQALYTIISLLYPMHLVLGCCNTEEPNQAGADELKLLNINIKLTLNLLMLTLSYSWGRNGITACNTH